MAGTGILALWNDCEPGHEAAYEAWYQGEHLAERLAVPGFLRGRRMQSLGDTPEYFTYYEVDTPDVLFTPVYRQLLDNPSPMTEQIMRETFRNMSRTVCHVERREGRVYGAYGVSIKLNAYDPGGPVAAFVDALVGLPEIARAEVWVAVDAPAGTETREETLRGGDDRISACLLVETLREASASEIARKAQDHLAATPDTIGVYRLLCERQSDGAAS